MAFIAAHQLRHRYTSGTLHTPLAVKSEFILLFGSVALISLDTRFASDLHAILPVRTYVPYYH